MFGRKSNVLSTTESTDLLESIMPYFTLPGFTILNIFETIANSEVENEKTRRICKQLVYGVIKENRKLEDLFLSTGVIKNNEYSIMAKANKTEKAIQDILDIRNISWKSEIAILKIIWFPWLLVSSTTGMIGFAFPLMVEYLKKQILQLNSKFDIYQTLPWFISNAFSFKIVSIFVFLLPFFVFFLYLYYYYNDTKKLYKFFKLKAYDDLPRYFTIMISLRNTGSNLREIMNELYQYPYPKPIAELWYYISHNDDMGRGFRLFNMPDDITKIVIRFTETNAIYETFENLKDLCTKRFNILVKRIDLYGNMIGKIFWFVPIYFLTQTITWIMTLFGQISSSTNLI